MKSILEKIFLVKIYVNCISSIAVIIFFGLQFKMSVSSPAAVNPSVFRGNKQTGVKSSDQFNQAYFDTDRMAGYYDPSVPLPDEQMLIMKLLKNYDPASRPVYNASNPVAVKFGFALIQLCDMDEKNQILTTNVWLEQEWFDERLKWNESEYNGLNKIRLPCNRIWLPDIVLYNSADDYTEGYMQSKAMVTSSGHVFWPPPVKLRSSCSIDVTFFPFDDQVCHLKFGSWTYSGLQVDLTNKSDTVDLSNYVKSGEWDLKNVIVERNVIYYPCCPEEPYPDVMFYIYIRRRILYYLTNIILPCVWLSILSLVGFWLPPDSGEKITLGITVLLAFSVFMLLIAENIPATSEMVPLIGIYLTTTMSLTSTSIVLTVLVLHLHHAGQFAPTLPRGFYNLMTKKVAVYIGLKQTVRRYETFSQINDDEDTLQTPTQISSKILKVKNSILSNCDNELESLRNEMKTNRLNSYNMNCCCKISSCFFDKSVNENECSKTIEAISINDPPLNQDNLKIPNNNVCFLKRVDIENIENLKKLSNNKETKVNVKKKGIRQANINDECNQSMPTQLHSNNKFVLNHSNSCIECNKTGYMNHLNSKNYNNLINSEHIRSLDIFSKHLKEYIKKEELNRINNNLQNEWKLIALIVDRLLFWLFAVITGVSTILLLVVLPILKNRELIKPYKSSVSKNFQ